MKMTRLFNRRVTYVYALTSVVLTFGFGAAAGVTTRWAFDVDCYKPGLGNTNTTDFPRVEWHKSGSLVGTTQFIDARGGTFGDYSCQENTGDLTFYHARTEGPLPEIEGRKGAEGLKVRVKATGSDAFWMDQVRLMHINAFFSPKIKWGKNNYKGYCLSTQSSDNFGSSDLPPRYRTPS